MHNSTHPAIPSLFKSISVLLLLASPVALIQAQESEEEMWVGAYLASWEHFVMPTGNWGTLPTNDIDWDAFTHLYYFALNVRGDGVVSEIRPWHNMSPDRVQAIVSAAHQNRTPVLVSVGGWGNYDGFSSAITPSIRRIFIRNLIQVLRRWGFDGIDLDMEPIRDSDVDNYKAFVRELYDELQQFRTPMSPRPLLTAATAWQPDLFSELQQYFDQINLMTYDLSGAWEGWVVWHNSSVYSAGMTFPGTDRPLPSVDRMVQEFLDAGVEKKKIGIGIDFYGYVWQGGSGTDTGGVTRPGQSWEIPPSVTDNVPYYTIMEHYYREQYYRWDSDAGATYLSIDRPGSSRDFFISYEDERAIEEKIRYAHNNELGGVFIWELAGGYLRNKPKGQRDLLLTFVRETVQNRHRLFSTDKRIQPLRTSENN